MVSEAAVPLAVARQAQALRAGLAAMEDPLAAVLAVELQAALLVSAVEVG